MYTELEDSSGTGGTRITFMSPQAESLLGYGPESFIADPDLWARLLHPDDAERVSPLSRSADAAGAPFDLEYRMIARDGAVRWFRDVSRLVDGDERYWHGVLFDITDQEQAREEARAAERRYQSLVETLPAVVFIDAMDEGATNIYTSPQTYELLGSVKRVQGGAELTVSDNGPGIPAGMHEAIFEPFRQGDTDVSSLGMGVGLAYAQRYAELQGGRIRAEDATGGGARFVVFLPI